MITVASYIISILLAPVISLVIYRLTLDPLRNYPGPIIAKFTDGYAGYHASNKCLHLATFFDHEKYGPIYRQGPNRLVFNSVNALQDIYLNPRIGKGHVYSQSQFFEHKNIFGTLDMEGHRQKRKLYGQVLPDRSLREFEPAMRKEVDVFLRLLLESKSEIVNMTPLCERLTTDIAGQLGFGQSLSTQTENTNRSLPRAMVSINFIISIFMAWPTISITWRFLRRLNRKNGSVYTSSLKRIINARMALPADAKHDFYSITNSPSGTEHLRLDRGQLWAEVVFFLPAGGTTLSAALSAVFFYLSRHPDVYERLASEIRTAFSSGTSIQNGPQLAGSKYLRAVIDETMRVSPPFVGTFWREPHSLKTESFVVDGHVIPRDTLVGVNPYCIMHNAEYFPDPFTYQPDRWLEPHSPSDSGESKQPRAAWKKAFSPFCLGETSCIGKPLAYLETSLVIATTLWYFDFDKAPGQAGKLGEGVEGRTDGRGRVGEYQLNDLLVSDHHGPNLVFKPRGEFLKELESSLETRSDSLQRIHGL
ncbi:cytochrome P450 [Xylariaceae sp. FL0016]|nr:cytochrome P450 [Xylariaceae sp. FL0016]